jgi:hypothetical protein
MFTPSGWTIAAPITCCSASRSCRPYAAASSHLHGEAARRVRIEGDGQLGGVFLETPAIMA